MSSKPRKWKFRIRHILDALAENQGYVSGMTYGEFCQDTQTLKAVVWNLMMMGEAARYVPPDIVAAFPEIPWQQMRGMRNHIVHGYDQID